jgi:predicted TIM-barrel fold metal-dependent hydrolase
MKIFDCHIHLFPDKIIRNVQQKVAMVQRLRLQTKGAEKRTSADTLKSELVYAGVEGALMLPTASVTNVRRTNRSCINTAAAYPFIKTAGTLHPADPGMHHEIDYLKQHRICIIKLCSFSQGFEIEGSSAAKMFHAIESANETRDEPFAVVLDTLRTANRHFGTPPEFNTTPKHLADLADRYPGINFIGAHMGGLDAPYAEIGRHLTVRPNLYLDTSNAAHTLSTAAFCGLVEEHGPDHILFGTDWPWFTHKKEIRLIDSLLDKVGFNHSQKCRVFHLNILSLLGMKNLNRKDG